MAKKQARRKNHSRRVKYDTINPQLRLIQLPVMALFLTLIVEFFNRGLNPGRLFDFVTGHPLIFLFNALIVLTTLTFSELFKRRRAVLCTMTLTWIVLGYVQYTVIKERTQPFCSVDILMIKDAFSLMTIYYTWPHIILMFGSGFAAIALVVLLFTRARRRKRVNYAASALTFAGFVMLCAMFSALALRSEMLPRRFDNMVDAYNDYGFPIVFTFTFGQQGISKPETYSTETVAEIMKDIDSEEDGELVYPVFDAADHLEQPNILFVQLESFFDVNTIVGSEYSADPTPTFNRLCRNFPSGLLYVPTIGGGTANTEFEIITGLNLDFFGAGELPYNTLMQQKAVETINYDLKEYGYTATALHSNGATFYSRNAVYPNMGFDRFVSLEYMQDMKYNDLGWAKDHELTAEVLKAFQSTEGRDVMLCVSVESHGKYAEEYVPKEGDIEIITLPEKIPLAPFQNFVNIIPATDEFLKELVHAIARFEEPTVVIAYGDHLPAMELENDMLTTGSIYASRYVIWNNFGRGFEAPDLQAYRLSANVMKQLGFTGGVIAKYHQSCDPGEAGEEYLDRLEQLQYDILYGENNAYEGETPYVPTHMTMGSVPVTIEDASREYGRLLVTGENFNEFSAVVIDDKPVDTAYVDHNRIVARMDDPMSVRSFAVAQVARDGTVLSQTKAFEFEG